MRIVFAGTPEAAVPSLRRLVADGHDLAAVVTRPDAALGRKRVLTPSPVASAAAQLGLPVIKTRLLDAAVSAQLAELGAELGVIVAFGALVREPLLSAPTHGWINLHFSLLPRWRGAAPVQHAVIAGDAVTGACVFQLEAGMDTGPVFDSTHRPIGADETAGQLLASLAEDGAGALSGVIMGIGAGTATARAQTGEPTLAPKLSIADGLLDLTQSAETVFGRLRGATPEPGAFAQLAGGPLKIHRASIAADVVPAAAGTVRRFGNRILLGTATAPLELLSVQPAGKTAMSAADWWRGAGRLQAQQSEAAR